MARHLVAASSMKLGVGVAILTAAPMTVSIWARPVSNAVGYTLMSISDNTVNNVFFLQRNNAGKVVWGCSNGGVGGQAQSTANTTAGAWNHCCGISIAANSKAAYVAGGNKGTDATNTVPPGLNRTDIGVNGGGGTFMDGDLAELAIWNIALVDTEVALIAKGVAPWLIHPEALVGYAPLWGYTSPEIELMKGNNFTLTNAPTQINHPPIFYR